MFQALNKYRTSKQDRTNAIKVYAVVFFLTLCVSAFCLTIFTTWSLFNDPSFASFFPVAFIGIPLLVLGIFMFMTYSHELDQDLSETILALTRLLWLFIGLSFFTALHGLTQFVGIGVNLSECTANTFCITGSLEGLAEFSMGFFALLNLAIFLYFDFFKGSWVVFSIKYLYFFSAGCQSSIGLPSGS